MAAWYMARRTCVDQLKSWSVDLGLKDLGVIISMMFMCNDIAIIEYDRRLGLPSAPLDMEYDNSNIEQ